MHHILGNKVLEYDVDDRGVIVDEREIDRTVNHKPNIADWVKEHQDLIQFPPKKLTDSPNRI